MGRRLFRIFEKDLSCQIQALKGMEINVVLKNKETIHGKLVGVEKTDIIIQDPMREKHTIRLSDICEVVYDKETSY